MMKKIMLFSIFSALLLVGTSWAQVYDIKGYYAVIQVPTDVSSSALKKAYHRLAMRWHPDRNLQNVAEATKKFQEIANAYDILSDPVKRRTYDALFLQRPSVRPFARSSTQRGSQRAYYRPQENGKKTPQSTSAVRKSRKPAPWFNILKNGFKENSKIKITIGAAALSYAVLSVVLKSIQQKSKGDTDISCGLFTIHMTGNGYATFRSRVGTFSIPL